MNYEIFRGNPLARYGNHNGGDPLRCKREVMRWVLFATVGHSRELSQKRHIGTTSFCVCMRHASYLNWQIGLNQVGKDAMEVPGAFGRSCFTRNVVDFAGRSLDRIKNHLMTPLNLLRSNEWKPHGIHSRAGGHALWRNPCLHGGLPINVLRCTW